MKLRSIMMVMALIAFLSTATGGYLYFSSLTDSAVREADRQAAAQVMATRNLVASNLAEDLKIVQALAGLKEFHQALADPSKEALEIANQQLDHFRLSMNFSVCYLMDRSGTTVATTNRDEPGSFLGQNYAFRPYFIWAMLGVPTTYMAVGVTTGIPRCFLQLPGLWPRGPRSPGGGRDQGFPGSCGQPVADSGPRQPAAG